MRHVGLLWVPPMALGFCLLLAFAYPAGAANLVDCGFDLTDAQDGSFAQPGTGTWTETDSLGNPWTGFTTAIDTGFARSPNYKASFANNGYIEVNLSGTSRSVGTVTFYYRANPSAMGTIFLVLTVNGISPAGGTLTGAIPDTYGVFTVPVNQRNVNALRWRAFITGAEALYVDDIVVTEGMKATVAAETVSPTKGGTVSYLVTFDRDTANFNNAADLTITAAPGVSYGAPTITPIDARNFRVQIAGATGTGYLSLAVNTASDVADTVGNPLLTSTSAGITLDNTGPVATVTNATPSPTNADTVRFRVEFDEVVQNFDNVNDVALSNTGGVSYLLASTLVLYTAGDSFYTVEVPGVDGNGTLMCEVSLASDTSDTLGNIVTASDQGQVLIDNTGPAATVSAFTPNPTNLDDVSFQVTFNEPVVNFDNMDEVLVIPSGVSYSASAVRSSAADLYYLDFSGVGGDGTLTATLRTGFTDIMDLAGNRIASSNATSIVIDNTAPTAVLNLVTSQPTGKDLIDFTATFSEPLNVSLSGFRSAVSLAGSLAAGGAAIGVSYVETPPSYRYTVTVDLRLTSPDADGTIGIDIGPGLADVAGNAYAGGSSILCQIYNFHGFTRQPASANRYVGESCLFEAVADTAAPRNYLVYQWKWDDGLGKAVHDIGADMTTYSIPSVASSDAGIYWCAVNYDSTAYLSNTAVLGVADHLEITGQPAGASLYVGESHTFAVATSGGFAPLSYLWRKDGIEIPDATTNTLTLTDLTLDDMGVFSVEVSDAERDVKTSDSAILTVAIPEPAAGVPALAVLAVTALLAGVAAIKRRR